MSALLQNLLRRANGFALIEVQTAGAVYLLVSEAIILFICLQPQIIIMDRLYQLKNPRLLKVLEIEDNYQKHKARLLKIETAKSQKKELVLEGINNYRRSRFISDMFKARDKRDRLVKENTMIHDNLRKVYTRKGSATSLRSLSKSYSQRSLVLTKRDSLSSRQSKDRLKKISEQNVRLRNKLLSTKSTLSKKTLMPEYKRTRTIEQQKISNNANKRRQQLAKLMLKHHYSKPVTSVLLLPKIKKGYSTSLS